MPASVQGDFARTQRLTQDVQSVLNRHSGSWVRLLPLALLGVTGLLLYSHDLGRVPPYLHHDELFFANQARSIAATGHDTHGRLLPLYFEVAPGTWFQPVLVYLTALVLKIAPMSETAFRLPTILVALADVVLVYFVAGRILRRESWALLAAALMLLTPAHVIHARLAMDYLYPVPFVLAWLLTLMLFLERSRSWRLLLATTWLGLGFFTYIGAMAMMPVYVLITCGVLWIRYEKSWPLLTIALAGFAWPVLLSIPFHLHHPDMLIEKWATYGPAAGTMHSLDPLQQARELFSYPNLTARVTLYSSFFDAGYLFLAGGGNILNSTRQAGVFLLPMAVFIPLGIYHLLQHRRDAIGALLVTGFFTAPLAALAVFENWAIDRELELLPFGVLLGTCGVAYLWSLPLTVRLRRVYAPIAGLGLVVGITYGAWTLIRYGRLSALTVPLMLASVLMAGVGALAESSRTWRPVAACLMILALFQFLTFYRDYLTDYPMRALGHFEFNRRAAITAVLDQDDVQRSPNIFVSTKIQYADASWRFYTRLLGRPDLESSAMFFDPEVLSTSEIARGSLVLTTATVAADHTFGKQAELTLVNRITEADGSESFLIFRRE
jgi:4-amino-4-deoxy-L-arabinose transferase-like glycosyltransferase